MFFRYLHRELRYRIRQSVLLSTGLAVGVGLVIFVTSVAAGVAKAQDTVMRSVYGATTQIAVTAPAPPEGPGNPCDDPFSEECPYQFFHKFHKIDEEVAQGGPAPESGSTVTDAAFVVQGSEVSGLLPGSSVGTIEQVPGVDAAAASLTGTNTRLTGTWGTATEENWNIKPVPDSGGTKGTWSTTKYGNWNYESYAYQVSGVDPEIGNVGPAASAEVIAGRALNASDTGADVAVVDTSFATPRDLEPGSEIIIAKQTFQVIGIVESPPNITPAAVYIPLDRAQLLAKETGNVTGSEIHTVYVTVDPGADIEEVEREISALLPQATVTSSDNLSGQVNGSFASSGLIGDLGRWLTAIVLIAAVALATLLTLAAVARRVREFGTLKALGWRSRRIVGQVLGEGVAKGIAGGLLGIALGVGAAALVSAVAPPLSTSIGLGPQGGEVVQLDDYHLEDYGRLIGAASATSRTVTDLHLSAPVSLNVILLAVALALASGLIAGAFGGWRAARLRPADALRRVE